MGIVVVIVAIDDDENDSTIIIPPGANVIAMDIDINPTMIDESMMMPVILYIIL